MLGDMDGKKRASVDQKGGEISKVIVSARSALNQQSAAQGKNSFDRFLGLMTQEDGAEQWTMPEEETIMLNTDAAIFDEFNAYNFSLIARNHRGEVVDASSKCFQGDISPDMAVVTRI